MKPANYKSSITPKKKKEVETIKNALLKYNVICIFDLNTLPSKQLQLIRHKLRGKIEVLVKKKRFIKLAIESIKNQKDLTHLLPYLDKGVPSLILTNEDPFTVYKIIKSSKSTAFAKAGQIAPRDLIVEAGPTNFPPGPIIGELGQAGIIAAVEQGKVVVKRETIITKAGDVITQKKADVLTKLGIQPMEVGLSILAAYENGTIYQKAILDVDEETYMDNLRQAALGAYNFTILLGYITKDNIQGLVRKSYLAAKAISESHNLDTDKTVKKELKEAEHPAKKEHVPEHHPAKKETQEAEEEVEEVITNEPEAEESEEETEEEIESEEESIPPTIDEIEEEAITQKETVTEPIKPQEPIKQPEKTSHVYSKTDEDVATGILEALKERDIKERARPKSQVYSKEAEEAAIRVLSSLKDEDIKDKTRDKIKHNKTNVPSAHDLAERRR